MHVVRPLSPLGKCAPNVTEKPFGQIADGSIVISTSCGTEPVHREVIRASAWQHDGNA